MSILIYRDIDGSDVVIRSPTDADIAEAWRVICERNKEAIEAVILREMRKSPFVAYLNTAMLPAHCASVSVENPA